VRRFSILLLAALLADLPNGDAIAAPLAEICYSPEQAFQSATPPDATTRYQCPLAGLLTLQELAQRGYRIVRLVPVSAGGGLMVRQQLTLQQGTMILADGFE
jgi:hypothetical protein